MIASSPDEILATRGALTLGELRGRLAILSVECEQCGRSGRYRLAGLITTHGKDTTLPDLAASMAENCEEQSSSANLRHSPDYTPTT